MWCREIPGVCTYCWWLLFFFSSACCLLFKWNLFAYSSKQSQDENVHIMRSMCNGCMKRKKTLKTAWKYSLAPNCCDESWVWMDDWHCWQTRNSFLNLSLSLLCSRRFGWRQTVFSPSRCLANVHFDHILLWKYPNIQIHFAPSHSLLTRCVRLLPYLLG